MSLHQRSARTHNGQRRGATWSARKARPTRSTRNQNRRRPVRPDVGAKFSIGRLTNQSVAKPEPIFLRFQAQPHTHGPRPTPGPPQVGRACVSSRPQSQNFPKSVAIHGAVVHRPLGGQHGAQQVNSGIFKKFGFHPAMPVGKCVSSQSVGRNSASGDGSAARGRSAPEPHQKFCLSRRPK